MTLHACLTTMAVSRSRYFYPTALSEFVFPHSLRLSGKFCNCINFCKIWHSTFQQLNTHTCCRWDDIFTKKWKCSFPNNLCQCNETCFTLSINTSEEGYIQFSQTNFVVTSFRLGIKVASFSEHQIKMTDTDRNKGSLFTASISMSIL